MYSLKFLNGFHDVIMDQLFETGRNPSARGHGRKLSNRRVRTDVRKYIRGTKRLKGLYNREKSKSKSTLSHTEIGSHKHSHQHSHNRVTDISKGYNLMNGLQYSLY